MADRGRASPSPAPPSLNDDADGAGAPWPDGWSADHGPVAERPMTRRVVVVGGGIAGLAAAWELARRGDGHRGDGAGGRRPPGRQDRHHRSWTASRSTRAPTPSWPGCRGRCDLCRELGLARRAGGPATAAGAYVATPTRPAAPARRPGAGGARHGSGRSLRSGPAVAPGAARAGLEPLLPGRALADDDDVALGRLVRRRFGREVHERLVDPLVGSINAGDTDHLSLVAAVPQLADVAAPLAQPAAGPALRREGPGRGGRGRRPGLPQPPAGLGHVVEVLAARLAEAGATVRHGHRRRGAGAARRGPLGGGARRRAMRGRRRSCWPPPAGVSADLLAAHAPAAAALLRGVEYASVVMVSLVVEPGDVGRRLDGTGLLVPRSLGHGAGHGGVVGFDEVGPLGAPAASGAAGLAGPRRRRPRPRARRRRPAGDGAPTSWAGSIGAAGRAGRVRVTPLAGVVPAVPAGAPRPGRPPSRGPEPTRPPASRLAGAAYRGLGIPACIRQGRQAAAARGARGRQTAAWSGRVTPGRDGQPARSRRWPWAGPVGGGGAGRHLRGRTESPGRPGEAAATTTTAATPPRRWHLPPPPPRHGHHRGPAATLEPAPTTTALLARCRSRSTRPPTSTPPSPRSCWAPSASPPSGSRRRCTRASG